MIPKKNIFIEGFEYPFAQIPLAAASLIELGKEGILSFSTSRQSARFEYVGLLTIEAQHLYVVPSFESEKDLDDESGNFYISVINRFVKEGKGQRNVVPRYLEDTPMIALAFDMLDLHYIRGGFFKAAVLPGADPGNAEKISRLYRATIQTLATLLTPVLNETHELECVADLAHLLEEMRSILQDPHDCEILLKRHIAHEQGLRRQVLQAMNLIFFQEPEWITRILDSGFFAFGTSDFKSIWKQAFITVSRAVPSRMNQSDTACSLVFEAPSRHDDPPETRCSSSSKKNSKAIVEFGYWLPGKDRDETCPSKVIDCCTWSKLEIPANFSGNAVIVLPTVSDIVPKSVPHPELKERSQSISISFSKIGDVLENYLDEKAFPEATSALFSKAENGANEKQRPQSNTSKTAKTSRFKMQHLSRSIYHLRFYRDGENDIVITAGTKLPDLTRWGFKRFAPTVDKSDRTFLEQLFASFTEPTLWNRSANALMLLEAELRFEGRPLLNTLSALLRTTLKDTAAVPSSAAKQSGICEVLRNVIGKEWRVEGNLLTSAGSDFAFLVAKSTFTGRHSAFAISRVDFDYCANQDQKDVRVVVLLDDRTSCITLDFSDLHNLVEEETLHDKAVRFEFKINGTTAEIFYRNFNVGEYETAKTTQTPSQLLRHFGD